MAMPRETKWHYAALYLSQAIFCESLAAKYWEDAVLLGDVDIEDPYTQMALAAEDDARAAFGTALCLAVRAEPRDRPMACRRLFTMGTTRGTA